jgi:LPS-assembly protein
LALYSEAKTDIFEFETKNIEILNQENKILAGKGVVKDLNGTKIFADNFEYFKNTNILKSYGNGKALYELENIEINFNKALIDGLNNTIMADENVILIDKKNELNIISESIFYDHIKKEISSEKKTKITDKIGNIYTVSSFIFEIKKNIIKVINLELVDIDKNIFTTNMAFINVNSGKLIGKDIFLEIPSFSENLNNKPRLKGKSIENDNDIAEIKKGIFTTCKIRDGCPPWELSSEKIKYDKKQETIFYEDAILKVYDLPVLYFPKFFHPSPNVKRRTGFLIPSFQNTQNSSNYLSLPYYYAIADNKDATLYPRLFVDEKFLLQTEYRQINKNSNHFLDFSYFIDNKEKNSNNHFFYDLIKKFKFKNFEESKLRLKMQKTSSDTYLKQNKIKSNNDYSENSLDNVLDINFYSNELNIDYNAAVYENLTLSSNDRFEYIFSKINLSKKIDHKTNFNGNFFFNSELLFREYNTNVKENQLYNELNIRSNFNQSNLGILSDHQILIKNLNSNNKNTNYKNKTNNFFSGIYQFNSSIPLIQSDSLNEKIIEPRLSLKISPKHTKDKRLNENKIDINNVYSINRLSEKDSTEGGLSLTYGSDYSIFNSSRKILDLQIANNLRLKKNDDLQNQNQMGEKTSNLFGKVYYNPNNFFEIDYNFALKNNLIDLNEENLLTTFKYNKLASTFDYSNENVSSLKNSYIGNKTSYLLDNSNELSFSTRKNKTRDLTEYYNFMYQYKNDCLAASIEYKKDFYIDRDVSQSESLVFKLTIIPVAETSSPNLRK